MRKPGSWIAGYRIERLLGSGGMGAVYLAKHPELPRSDALKVLTADTAGDEQFRLRFLREAEVAAALDHPNIVTIYNRGRAEVPGEPDGLLWIAMQYVPGSDCAAELAAAGRGMPPRRVARIISETAKGVDYAHRRGLLHRDIKPANILLSRLDDDSTFDEQRVFLTDFGVAKPTDEADTLTVAGTVLATLSYASPEQLTAAARVDGRTDQYSLAATAFHMLTGRVPFDDHSASAVIRAHLTQPVPRVSMLVPGLSPAVDAVIAKAMAKSPADRFGSCREFADALTMAIRQTGTPPPVVPAAPAPGIGGVAARSQSGPQSIPMSQPAPSYPPLPPQTPVYGAGRVMNPAPQPGPAPPPVTGPRGGDNSSSYTGFIAVLLALAVIAVIVIVLIVSNLG